MTEPLDELLQAIASRADRSSFNALFVALAPRLKGYFVRRGCSPAAAEELIQEVMMRIWTKASTFDAQRAEAVTWIFTIARNCLIDRVRREKRPEIDPDELEMRTPPMEVDKEADERRQGRRLHDALSQLPSEQAEVVVRSYFEGKSLADIASEQKLPLGTIKTRARLGLERLRTLIGTSAPVEAE